MSFTSRLSNAWRALTGERQHVDLGQASIVLTADTGPLEDGLKRAKEAIESFAAASKIPPPKLLLTSDRRLSMEMHQRLQETLIKAVEDGKVPILEDGMVAYQLFGGFWYRLGETPLPLTETPIAEEVQTEG